MAFVSLSHGYTGTIPKSILGFGFLVVVKPTGTEWRTERHLVFRQALDDDRGYGLVGTEFGTRIVQILVGERRHGFGGLFQNNHLFFRGYFLDDRQRQSGPPIAWYKRRREGMRVVAQSHDKARDDCFPHVVQLLRYAHPANVRMCKQQDEFVDVGCQDLGSRHE
jgi:hypothetical protein